TVVLPHPLIEHTLVKDWLDRLYSVGDQDGSSLVMALGTPRDGKPGMTDNCFWTPLSTQAGLSRLPTTRAVNRSSSAWEDGLRASTRGRPLAGGRGTRTRKSSPT